ncbi:hypothetical protein H6F96_19165 [Microcoleus sp. FACHB-53]|nr:hypothetical protein [Microcoleus sp. FACHB-53]
MASATASPNPTQRPRQAKNAVRLMALVTFTCNCSTVYLMTASMSKVYEETYLNRWIEIYCFSQFAPGGVGSSHFFARIDDWQMPGTFDHRSHNPNRPSDNTDNQSTPETSSALVAARAYCDSEADALIRRSNEQMHLTLSYREAKTLLRAMRFAFKHEQIATHDLQKRIELLLQEPSAVELTHKTNSLSRTLMKIRRFVGITKK